MDKNIVYQCIPYPYQLDKVPRLSISIVIWILSSDTICQLNQFNTNSEAAMLSRLEPMYLLSKSHVRLFWHFPARFHLTSSYR